MEKIDEAAPAGVFFLSAQPDTDRWSAGGTLSRTDSIHHGRFPAWLGLILCAGLLVPRLFHLIGPIDDPHSWRQCDTIFYSLDLFRRGFDVLHPRVCWMGPHGTLIFEFPLTEAMAAALYRINGVHYYWDRLISLGFFAIAAFYLHRLAGRMAPPRAAWLATLAYFAFPLGQVYSRSAQPDFAATAFVHAFLFHAIAAAEGRSSVHAVLAAMAGSLAALIKGPYLIAVLPPLAFGALAIGDGGVMVLLLLTVAIPAGVFWVWRRWVDQVNATAPDWSFLPGWYREVNPTWWYFGTPEQRMQPELWEKLGHRVLRHVLTVPGAMLAGIGVLAGRPRMQAQIDPRGFAVVWLAGVAVYVAIFFNLNVVHTYYQIPILAPLALLVGIGADGLWGRLPRWAPVGPLVFVAFAAMALLAPPGLGYYQPDWLRVEAAREIAAHVPDEDLMIACDHASGWSDPRLLARADRVGWSLAIPDLTPGRVGRLRALGARWIAVVMDPEHPELRSPSFLAAARTLTTPIEHGGRTIGTLELFKLAPAAGGASPRARAAPARDSLAGPAAAP